jgi:hypothetical protein
MKLEQFPAQFVNIRQMASVPEGAAFAGGQVRGTGQ